MDKEDIYNDITLCWWMKLIKEPYPMQGGIF